MTEPNGAARKSGNWALAVSLALPFATLVCAVGMFQLMQPGYFVSQWPRYVIFPVETILVETISSTAEPLFLFIAFIRTAAEISLLLTYWRKWWVITAVVGAHLLMSGVAYAIIRPWWRLFT
jgi:hypothetical protein